jgi:hypothetical protein
MLTESPIHAPGRRPRGRPTPRPGEHVLTADRPIVALARGAAFHLTFTVASLGALTAWARFCEARRHRV